MAQVLNTNVMALNSMGALNRTQGEMMTSLGRLSSGIRINAAKDDAAGLATSERMTSQINGLWRAVRNAADGVSLVQTAEGALEEVNNALQRMRELAVQAKNGTYAASDRASLQDEYAALKNEIIRITDVTEFNNINLLGNTDSIALQVGWENGTNNVIKVSTFDLVTATSGSGGLDFLLGGNNSIGNAGSASTVMAYLTAAIDLVSEKRSDFGAVQNRLESAMRNMESVAENQSAARSRVLDADFAQETASLTRIQILQDAGTSMLAQANVLPANALILLG